MDTWKISKCVLQAVIMERGAGREDESDEEEGRGGGEGRRGGRR